MKFQKTNCGCHCELSTFGFSRDKTFLALEARTWIILWQISNIYIIPHWDEWLKVESGPKTDVSHIYLI